MSVRTEFYTVFGVKTGRLREFSDWLDENNKFDYHKSTTGYVPDILMDYMDSKYCIFGKVLFHANDEYDVDVDIDIDPENFDLWEAEYRTEFAKSFPDFVDILPKTKFKLYSLLSYS